MKGSTLIETLIYIALLAILMLGVFSSIYMTIRLEERSGVIEESDSDLLLKNYHE